MTDFLILLFFLALAFIVSFAAGANDEMMAPGVSSGVFSLKTAVNYLKPLENSVFVC